MTLQSVRAAASSAGRLSHVSRQVYGTVHSRGVDACRPPPPPGQPLRRTAIVPVRYVRRLRATGRPPDPQQTEGQAASAGAGSRPCRVLSLSRCAGAAADCDTMRLYCGGQRVAGTGLPATF